MKKTDPEAQNASKLVCGLVMPISSLDGCPDTHWLDVKEIIFESIIAVDFEPQMVSEADDVGIIQKRIIQNLYENPVVVCDVSGKNPNVMFELGMRLAFDKPTIIIKDDKTSYSFDTAPIEHIEYPRDLRFSKIVAFKEELGEKILATYKKSSSDESYTTFLKHFGTFNVPKLDTKEVSKETIILDELAQFRQEFQQLRKQIASPSTYSRPVVGWGKDERILCLRTCTEEIAEQVVGELRKIEGINEVERADSPNGHTHLLIKPLTMNTRVLALSCAREIAPTARYL